MSDSLSTCIMEDFLMQAIEQNIKNEIEKLIENLNEFSELYPSLIPERRAKLLANLNLKSEAISM